MPKSPSLQAKLSELTALYGEWIESGVFRKKEICNYLKNNYIFLSTTQVDCVVGCVSLRKEKIIFSYFQTIFMKIESTFSFNSVVITQRGEMAIPASTAPIKVVNGVATGIPASKEGVTFLVNKKVYDDNPTRQDFCMWNPDGKFDDPTDGKTKYRSIVTRLGVHFF